MLTTLDDVIYIRMKNDISLLLHDTMNLWEQQSSYNPNMPVRGLMYFGSLYEAYLSKDMQLVYSSKLNCTPKNGHRLWKGRSDIPEQWTAVKRHRPQVVDNRLSAKPQVVDIQVPNGHFAETTNCGQCQFSAKSHLFNAAGKKELKSDYP